MTISSNEFTTVYSQFRSVVRDYLYRLRRDAALADDLTQDVFLIHHRTAAGWNQENSIKSRLIGIARSLFLDLLKAEKVRPPFAPLNCDVPAPTYTGPDEDTLSALQTALASLLSSVRAQGDLLRASALQRILGQGERTAAVARDLCISEVTARSWKLRAVAELRAVLTPCLPRG